MTPNGTQTLSKMPSRYVNGVYPKFLEYGSGSRVFDINGVSYIDLISGLGAISVGYNNFEVNEAISDQLAKGVLFSLATTLEGKAAKKLIELMPFTDMWKFGKNGTDGTVMAVRAARAYTGRTKIMTVGYNGCADQFEIKGIRTAGIPRELESTIVKAIYNFLPDFSALLNQDVACVLLEPMVFDEPQNDFLNQLRSLCSETGTLLIFDEVVTGGRFKGFAASNYFKVEPDIIVVGKGLANGLPISAVGGKRHIMSTFERDDFFASGTFGSDTLALAGFLKTQELLVRSFSQMECNGQRIKESFNKLPWEAKCKGYPTRLTFDFSTKEHKALFMQEMCLQGVLIGHTNFIMAAHTDRDVTDIIEAIYESYKILRDNWSDPKAALKGSMPVEVMRLR